MWREAGVAVVVHLGLKPQSVGSARWVSVSGADGQRGERDFGLCARQMEEAGAAGATPA